MLSRHLPSLSLRTRFFLGVGVILLCFCSICAYIIYRQGKLLIEEASRAKSQIVMAAVEANMNYVRQVLRPKLYEVMGKDAFVMEGMSTSYVSRPVWTASGRPCPNTATGGWPSTPATPTPKPIPPKPGCSSILPPTRTSRIGRASCRSTGSPSSCCSVRSISAPPASLPR